MTTSAAEKIARKTRWIALSWALASAATVGWAQERAFDFALIGDTPYTKTQESEYRRLLGTLNANDLAFVVHVGDFQIDPRGYNPNPARSSMPCVDENYQWFYESVQTVRSQPGLNLCST